MQKRNYFIDDLRFIAAFIVVVFHLNQSFAHIDNSYSNVVRYGWLGVPIFFVISGYCIIISAHHSVDFVKFFKKRFFRIFPAYWFSLFIVLSSAVVQKITTGYNSVSNIPDTFKGIIANITLTTAPFTNIKTMNWVYWSLTYEIFFYIIIGVIMMFHKKFFPRLLISISLLSCLNLSPQVHYLFFLDNWPIFSLGITAYYLNSYTNKKDFYFIVAFFLINCSACFINFRYQLNYVFVSLVTFALIVFSNYFPIKKTVFSHLGQYSYSVYLIHVPIGVFLLGRLKTLSIQQNLFLNILFDTTVYCIISVISKYIYQCLEKPLIRYSQS